METQERKMKKKPTKMEDMTKEQIRRAILKKRECNAKAQRIVESLLEKGISDTYLLQSLPDINQSHFEDITEERAIIHLCGYPKCQNSLPTEIPKQKYRISLKTNKVYDITTRKNFCSNTCYKAAMYVKQQLLTSPLWFREYEEIPKFSLMPLDTVGSLGQEIDVSFVERIKVTPKVEWNTSISGFTSASLNDIGDTESEKNKQGSINNNQIDDKSKISEADNLINNTPKVSSKDSPGTNVKDQAVDQQETTCSENSNITNSSEEIKPKKSEIPKKQPNPFNIVGEVIERPERKIDPILVEGCNKESKKPITVSAKKVVQKKQPSVAAITIEVEKCLAEWFTLDTLLLLFGEEKVKEMVTDKGECIKEYLNNYSRSIFHNSNSYDQYQALCRKLNMLELEDRRYDAQTLQKETKPLPDYSLLKEESKKMQLKVKAFFAGETNIPEPETLSNATEESKDEDNLTQLPLVDKNAQNALRRRLVRQQLNKVLPDLLQSLGLLSLSISGDVSLIVNTFKLKANNIMFKPIQWTLIALVIIKLLSLRDRRLEYLLEQPTAYKHMQLLLLSYKQDGGYIDRLISWLTDIDRLLDTSDIQLTIE